MDQSNNVKSVSFKPLQQDNECCNHDHGHEHAQEHGHEHDPQTAVAHADQENHEDDCCTPHLTSEISVAPAGAAKIRYRIDKMDCPTEERLIRNKLEPMEGVVRLDFNLIDRELTVYHSLENTNSFLAALTALDMAPVALENNASVTPLPPALTTQLKLLLLASGVTAVAAEVTAWVTQQESSPYVIALAVLSIGCAGIPTLKKGWIALKNLTLNIYFLMSLAVIGAVIIGKWPEAAMVVFLFALAEAIEALSLERARNAIKSLVALAPEQADVLVGDQWQAQPVSSVALGARIRVRTGARVPLDARMESGRAALNQAPITGESLPVEKQTGDPLFAGSIVTDGVVEAIVTAVAGQSTLARIAAAIQQAQSQRAPTQRFVDQFARYYTPIVVTLAVAVALLGPFVLGGDKRDWLYQALVILVIACPCALVVSTPVTVVSGLAAAARKGILIKGGAYLEAGRLLKAVALDKTGTLTEGKPSLTDAIAVTEMPIQKALHIAASLDHLSTHPIAVAIVKGWQNQSSTAMLPVAQFAVMNGSGVKGEVEGQLWQLGNHRLVESLGVCSPELEAQLTVLENEGKTAIVLVSSCGPVAIFGVADTVRRESAEAVVSLQKLGVEPIMLTGDNTATARAIAGQLGINDARGNLLPEDKQAAVGEMNTQFGPVGMVGDGINDAPALARADIGFAMGAAGTATALETADVAIMDDDPRKIGEFIQLSRRTSAVLKQNISLALGIKAVFLVLAFGGQATLWMAVFADMGASLLVVFNGLRLLRA